MSSIKRAMRRRFEKKNQTKFKKAATADMNVTTEVAREALRAYCDCKPLADALQTMTDEDEKTKIIDKAMSVRQLNFKASVPINRDAVTQIMNMVCPEYGNFKPDLLQHLPEDCKITLAREDGVCLYVHSTYFPLPETQFVLDNMLASTVTVENNVMKILWKD